MIVSMTTAVKHRNTRASIRVDSRSIQNPDAAGVVPEQIPGVGTTNQLAAEIASIPMSKDQHGSADGNSSQTSEHPGQDAANGSDRGQARRSLSDWLGNSRVDDNVPSCPL